MMLNLRQKSLTLLSVYMLLHQPCEADIRQTLWANLARALNTFEQCGLQRVPIIPMPPGRRVIRGDDVIQEGKWPWMAYLYYPELGREDGFFCGGTLIDTEWVLTAAHCIKSPNEPSKYRVILGERDIGDITGHEKDRGISKIVKHPYFAETTFENDVALLKLSEPMFFSDYVRPACLPPSGYGTDADEGSDSFAGKNCTVLGWGRTENRIKSKILQFAELTIMPKILCNSVTKNPVYRSPVLYSSPQICAFGQDGQDTCYGDSGGPLLCKQNNQYYLHGVTSYGVGKDCGLKNPTIYGQVRPTISRPTTMLPTKSFS